MISTTKTTEKMHKQRRLHRQTIHRLKTITKQIQITITKNQPTRKSTSR